MSRLHLPIQNPCHEDWDAMQRAAGSRRFCEQCSKHVHDLSAMTEPEARDVLASEASKGRVCVRYTLDVAGEIKFKPQTTSAPNFWRMTLAAAGMAMALLTGCADGEPDRVRSDACVYEIGPWSFEVARGQGTCPAELASEDPEPMIMGELEAIDPLPEPSADPELDSGWAVKGDVAPVVEVQGEAPMVEPPPPVVAPHPQQRMGKIAPPAVEVEMLGDIAAVPDQPCEPTREGPRRL